MIYQITNPTLLDSILSNQELQKVCWEGFPYSYENISAEHLLNSPGAYFTGYGNPIKGVYAFHQVNNICWELHCNIPPQNRQSDNLIAGKEALKWMFTNNPACNVITGIVPTKYPNAISFAYKLGMSLDGICKNSFSVDGILYHRYLFSIERV